MEDKEERTARETKEVEAFYSENPEFRPPKSTWARDIRQAAGDRPQRLGGESVYVGLDFSERQEHGQAASGRVIWKNTSMEQRETRQRVERIIETLSETRQDLLRRYYWEQQTLQEIATDYGVSYQAIQQRLDTARGAFSRALVKMAYAGELDLVEEEGI